MPAWSLEEVKKEMQDVAAFLHHKKAASHGQEMSSLEESMQKGIISKIQSLPMTAATSLALYKVLDEECISFSDTMKSKVKAEIDSALTSPPGETTVQQSLKCQTIDLPKYLTENDWQVIKSSGSYHAKVKVLVTRMAALGLKALSEKSVRSAAACLLCSLTQWPDANAILQIVNDIKLAFTACTRNTADIPVYITYPDDPKSIASQVLIKMYGPDQCPSLHVPEQYTLVCKKVIMRKSHAEFKKLESKHNLEDKKHDLHRNATHMELPHMSGSDMFMKMIDFMTNRSTAESSLDKLLHIVGDRKALGDASSHAAHTSSSHVQPQEAPLPLTDVGHLAPKTRMATDPFPKASQTDSQESVDTGAPPVTPSEPATGSGKAIEDSAFQALKAKSAQAKEKANKDKKPKGKAKPKSVAKVALKKPAASTSSLGHFKYHVGTPEARWEGKYESWNSKHYHAAKSRAHMAGYSADDCTTFARQACQKAKEIYKKTFGC